MPFSSLKTFYLQCFGLLVESHWSSWTCS